MTTPRTDRKRSKRASRVFLHKYVTRALFDRGIKTFMYYTKSHMNRPVNVLKLSTEGGEEKTLVVQTHTAVVRVLSGSESRN